MTVTDALRGTVGFAVGVWVGGCALSFIASRRPPTPSHLHQAGRRYGLGIETVLAYEDEVVESLGGEPGADPLSGTFRARHRLARPDSPRAVATRSHAVKGPISA